MELFRKKKLYNLLFRSGNGHSINQLALVSVPLLLNNSEILFNYLEHKTADMEEKLGEDLVLINVTEIK